MHPVALEQPESSQSLISKVWNETKLEKGRESNEKAARKVRGF